MNRFFAVLIIAFAACSPRTLPPDPEASKPLWLQGKAEMAGYYTGVGHSRKSADHNYIQAAKKSALDDLVSQIKVNVSSTSVLSQFEADKKFSEQYEQIIQTTVADEIEEFEMVDAWEDATSYWVYYRLSVSRYRQIKEEQKRNATMLATDYFGRARSAEASGDLLQALGFYFQSFRAVDKYLGEAIRVTHDGREILLVNEIYASIQTLLNRIKLTATPSTLEVNRRIQNSSEVINVTAKLDGSLVPDVPLHAAFEKGAGSIFPSYTTDRKGESKILLNQIGSKDLEQIVVVRVNIDALSGTSGSPVYDLIVKTLKLPETRIHLKVQRPLVFLSANEKSFGNSKANNQLSNRLKNLLTTNGFEFTNDKTRADLWFDVQADAERGSVTGSIYVTYLTGVIRVTAVREGKEIYATVLDRIKGFGLDYDKSSVDAYNKAMETLEKEKMEDLINMVLQ